MALQYFFYYWLTPERGKDVRFDEKVQAINGLYRQAPEKVERREFEYILIYNTRAESIDQQSDIPTHRVEDRAGAAVLAVFFHFEAGFLGRSGSGDAINQIFRHQVPGALDLLFGSRPAQDGLDLSHDRL